MLTYIPLSPKKKQDLAALLPNLTQIRRPSKSSIVNSSIAHVHASRRHRLLAARELRILKHEADALRREINEWRDRAGVPRVEEPGRGEGFGMVISGEMEVLIVGGEEEEEDGDEFGVGPMTGQPQQQYGGGYGGMDMEDEDGGVQLGYASVPPPPQVLPSSVLAQMQQQQQQHHAQQQQQQAMAHHQMHHPQQQHHQMSFANGNAHAGNPFAHNLPPPPPSSGGGVMSSRPGTGGYDAGYFGYSQVNIHLFVSFALC